VACKITEVLNPESRIAIFPRALDFRHASETSLQGYVRGHEDELKRCLGKKQLGILFENNLYGAVHDEHDPESEPAFMNCRGATIYHYRLGEMDMGLVGSMAPSLSNQNVL